MHFDFRILRVITIYPHSTALCYALTSVDGVGDSLVKLTGMVLFDYLEIQIVDFYLIIRKANIFRIQISGLG